MPRAGVQRKLCASRSMSISCRCGNKQRKDGRWSAHDGRNAELHFATFCARTRKEKR